MLKSVLATCLVTVALGGIVPLKKHEIDEFIVGGNNTDITKIPFQISLHIDGEFSCGGSIVAPQFVVTAAHCVFDQETKDFTVRAGSTKNNEGGVLLKLKKFTIHPKYTGNKQDYDVAVLELEKPLTYSNKIKPIALATKEPTAPGTVKTSGWGALDEDTGDLPEILQSVEVPVVDRKVCKKAYEEYGVEINELMVCAGKEGKDSCQGDSGGPLVQNDKLAGVVSFGLGCARKDYAGVYASVSHPDITSFIKKVANL